MEYITNEQLKRRVKELTIEVERRPAIEIYARILDRPKRENLLACLELMIGAGIVFYVTVAYEQGTLLIQPFGFCKGCTGLLGIVITANDVQVKPFKVCHFGFNDIYESYEDIMEIYDKLG